MRSQVLQAIHTRMTFWRNSKSPCSPIKATRNRSGSAKPQECINGCPQLRRRLELACVDRLDGKIAEEFWEATSAEWQEEEQAPPASLRELEQAENPERALDRVRILELANKAYSLYVTQPPQEKAKLLRMVLSNCAVDAVSVYPTYRKPFDMIFERAKT